MGIGLPARIIVPWCVAGKNPADQLPPAFGGKPRTSGSTTNVGRLSAVLPSPYEIHAPMLGKPGNTKPLFCMKVAGPWTFDFDTIEWMKAISSAHEPMCGTSSLIHLPHWPDCFQSHGLFITAPGS